MMEIKDLADEKRETYNPNPNEDIPYVGLDNVQPQALHIDFISSSKEVGSTKYKFEKGDILFGTLRPYFKKLVRPNFDGVCSTEFSVIKTKSEKDKNFLFYAMAQDNFIDYANVNSNGARPRTKWKLYSNYKLKFFNAHQREKLGNILSSYDDLIENNRRRIQLLEYSARLLYKEWFIHFKFPGHEHVKIIDGLPKDWEQQKIADLTQYLSRGISPNYDDEAECIVINQKCIRNNRLNLELVRRQSKDYAKEKQVKLGDILINSTGTGTLGRVAQVWEEIEKCTVDSHVTIVRPKEEIGYCWFGYCLSFLEPVLENSGEGSTNQKELNRSRIAEMQLIFPSKTLRRNYEEIVVPIKEQIQNLTNQNIKLKEARDLLLPRLMNGDIAV